MKTRRFEFTKGTSNKFWQVTMRSNGALIQWGKIDGHTSQQTIGHKEAHKRVAQKLGKGYREIKP